MAEEKTEITKPTDVDLLNLAKKPFLIVMSGNDIGKKYPVSQAEIIIGRSMDAQIVVKENNVSRRHSRLTFKNGKAMVEDLGSTNGTFVNSEKITQCELGDGDLISVGKTILKFSYQSDIDVALHDEIYDSATVDELTRLYNRKYFQKHIESEFARGERYGREVSLIILDLDFFKKMNDTNGHQAGDLVLKSVGKAVKDSIRSNVDVPARFGGEEFAVLLPETSFNFALKIAEKIRAKIESLRMEFQGKTLTITASLGVASNRPEITSVDQLIRVADEKLYEAKRNGKNRVEG